MSVATTRPLLPTRRHSQAAIEPPPPPISQHCQPSSTSNLSKCRIVPGSRNAPSRSRRSRARCHELSKRYVSVPAAPDFSELMVGLLHSSPYTSATLLIREAPFVSDSQGGVDDQRRALRF